MYESTGQIKISGTTIRLVCDRGIVEYYKHLIEKRWFGAKLQLGKYGSHISIVYKQDKVSPEQMKGLRHLHNKKVKFKYDPYVHMGGFNKDFKNFYISCMFNEFFYIREQLNLPIDRTRKGGGAHITICNNKNV